MASISVPNWLEMPHDLMTNIFLRLRTIELLISARKVCTTWRIICKDPALWKVIYMHKFLDDFEGVYDFEMLTRQAVDLSCGELIDISLDYFGSRELLHYIVQHSSKLKCLSIGSFSGITASCLNEASKMVPQLEKLHLSSINIHAKDIKVIGRNCPQLKSFKIADLMCPEPYDQCDVQAVAIANNMPELRHLQIYGDKMTSNGFQALLNSCPHLESLDIYTGYCFFRGGKLGKLCMERIKDFKHN